MLDHYLVEKYFKEFHNTPIPFIIRRDISLSDANRPQMIIGARHVGRTFLMFQKMEELMKSGIRKSQLVYLNFEDTALIELTVQEISQLLEIYWGLFPDEIEQQLYLFIDEAHVIHKWENAIRSLMNYEFPMYITSSSSKLMSNEIASTFRGRATPVYITSLSFREFLRFKKVSDILPRSTKQHAQFQALFKEYVKYGGYPEVVLAPEHYKKKKILRDYFDMIVYKDLVVRYNIKNNNLIKQFIIALMQHVGKEVNINKIHKDFKSRKINTTTDTLYRYFEILQKTGIFYTTYRYELSYRRQMRSSPKLYIHDLGLYSIFHQEQRSAQFENLAFLHLQRYCNQNPNYEISCMKTTQQKEIDLMLIKHENTYSK